MSAKYEWNIKEMRKKNVENALNMGRKRFQIVFENQGKMQKCSWYVNMIKIMKFFKETHNFP